MSFHIFRVWLRVLAWEKISVFEMKIEDLNFDEPD